MYVYHNPQFFRSEGTRQLALSLEDFCQGFAISLQPCLNYSAPCGCPVQCIPDLMFAYENITQRNYFRRDYITLNRPAFRCNERNLVSVKELYRSWYLDQWIKWWTKFFSYQCVPLYLNWLKTLVAMYTFGSVKSNKCVLSLVSKIQVICCNVVYLRSNFVISWQRPEFPLLSSYSYYKYYICEGSGRIVLDYILSRPLFT